MKTELQLAMSLMAVVGGMILAPGCIPKEEKKEGTKATPAPPAPPPPEPARSALKITPGASYTLLAVESNKCVQFPATRKVRTPRSRAAWTGMRSDSSWSRFRGTTTSS